MSSLIHHLLSLDFDRLLFGDLDLLSNLLLEL
jgi:hypothetical protein